MTTDTKFTLRRDPDIESWDDKRGPGWVLDGIAEHLEMEPWFLADQDRPVDEAEAKQWAANLIDRAIDVRVCAWEDTLTGFVPLARTRQHHLTIETGMTSGSYDDLERWHVQVILQQLENPDAVIEIKASEAKPAKVVGTVKDTTYYPVRNIQRIRHRVTETPTSTKR